MINLERLKTKRDLPRYIDDPVYKILVVDDEEKLKEINFRDIEDANLVLVADIHNYAYRVMFSDVPGIVETFGDSIAFGPFLERSLKWAESDYYRDSLEDPDMGLSSDAKAMIIDDGEFNESGAMELIKRGFARVVGIALTDKGEELSNKFQDMS